jgi:hypothetical protein
LPLRGSTAGNDFNPFGRLETERNVTPLDSMVGIDDHDARGPVGSIQ